MITITLSMVILLTNHTAVLQVTISSTCSRGCSLAYDTTENEPHNEHEYKLQTHTKYMTLNHLGEKTALREACRTRELFVEQLNVCGGGGGFYRVLCFMQLFACVSNMFDMRDKIAWVIKLTKIHQYTMS